MGRCLLCERFVDDGELLGHLRDKHDIELDVETWPDGELVVIDKSLEPDDFLR